LPKTLEIQPDKREMHMKDKLHIHVIFGTRPEAVKLAPVIRELRSRPDNFVVTVVFTAQHRELVKPILHFFAIEPEVDFDIMKEAQTPSDITAQVLQHLQRHFTENRVDAVIVQGDTTTAMASAMAAFYRKIPVVHVEAGLRTHDRYNPFPEEINRRLISSLATLHCAATEGNRAHLLQENIPDGNIILTGNPVIDALHSILDNSEAATSPAFPVNPEQKMILLTTHRRENFGDAQRNIFRAVRRLVETHPDVDIIFPVHPNPAVRRAVEEQLPPHDRIHLVAPLEYIDFIRLLRRCTFVMSDSGGMQEEAPALGKPLLVLRSTTERPEVLETGSAILAGTEEERIYETAHRLLTDTALYESMSRNSLPFGRGDAARIIADAIESRIVPQR
jgi:UDP-N-acetylglucosamine 2-epimerase (non-hydrolysing)